MPGSLHITFGPMFSGKTSFLLKTLDNYATVKKIRREDFKALVINSSIDNRNLNKVGNLTTHRDLVIESFNGYDVIFKSVKKLSDIPNNLILNSSYIAIDEAQFFDDLEDFVKKYITTKDIHVSGLIADTNKNEFGHMIKLFPIADNINQLKAFCAICKNFEKNASFTKWKSKEEKINRVHISGSEDYYPVCGKHY